MPGPGHRPRAAPLERRRRRPRLDRRRRPRRADRRGRRDVREDGARGCARARLQGHRRAARRRGLALAHEYKPDAIVLDMRCPAWTAGRCSITSSAIPDTRHIPVHVVTGAENGKQHALRAGAVAFLEKPVEKTLPRRGVLPDLRASSSGGVRNLLVVDDESDAAPGDRSSCSETARTSTSPRSARARRRSQSSSRGRSTAWCST